MILPKPYPIPPPALRLRFACGGCGQGLEAAMEWAGVTAPCPQCGTPVKACQDLERAISGTGAADGPPGSAAFMGAEPKKESSRSGGLHLPPLNKDTGLVDFPENFWLDEVEVDHGRGGETSRGEPGSDAPDASGARVPVAAPDLDSGCNRGVKPLPAVVPEATARALPTRDEEEAAEVAGRRRKEFRLRFFDAALILLFAGTVAMGGAAVAFTQPKHPATPAPPPELSRQVMERMAQTARQRDQAVQGARGVVQDWLTALEPAAVEPWCLPGDPVPAIPGMSTIGAAGNPMGPPDFEFIQTRRMPGTDRFLTMFEILADPPLVVPVEETPTGPRLHGRAIVQQQRGSLAEFLASQGQGEAVFYVLLRPGPGPMAEELVKARPDLKPFLHVAVEPAFPAEGASSCLACLAPDSEAAAIFAKRIHDPGLRPAVVKLAWRQHRESGNYVELVSFEPNAWSRH